jgi:hypothetical protein
MLKGTYISLSPNDKKPLSSFSTPITSTVSVQTESADQIKSTGKEAARLLNDNHGTKEAYQDFSCPFRHWYEHNIHDPDPADNERNTGDRTDDRRPRGQILTQFLIESVVLTLIGGLIGIGLGYGGASLPDPADNERNTGDRTDDRRHDGRDLADARRDFFHIHRLSVLTTTATFPFRRSPLIKSNQQEKKRPVS